MISPKALERADFKSVTLRKHRKNHHEIEKTLVCRSCNLVFGSEDELKIHKINEHCGTDKKSVQNFLKKHSPKKTPVKNTPMKKSPMKKSPPKKTPLKNTPEKKSLPTKTPLKWVKLCGEWPW